MKFNREDYISASSPIKTDLLTFFNRESDLIIFDIGGCEGEESIRYSRIFPYSTIFVFEPLPKNQRLILENISKYEAKRIELIPKAVSDSVENSQFFVSSGQPKNCENFDWDFGNKSSSLFQPKKENNPKWLQFNSEITVETTTLDMFCSLRNLNEVDFIHMDVQGAELKVLKGAKNYIQFIKSIWLEVADIELYKNQPLRNEIESFMSAHNFFLYKSEIKGGVGDQFYLNKNYFQKISLFSFNRYLKRNKPEK